MRQQYSGFDYGECIVCDNHCFVLILKNSSTWLQNSLNGTITNFEQNKIDLPYVVVLRDPVNRWVSGACEYLSNRSTGTGETVEQFCDYALENVLLDMHTEPQTSFIENVSTDRCTWFYCDNFLTQKFSSWALENKILNFESSNENNSKDNEKIKWFAPGTIDKRSKIYVPEYVPGHSKNQIRSVLFSKLKHNKNLKRVKDHYKNDYALIRSVAFR